MTQSRHEPILTRYAARGVFQSRIITGLFVLSFFCPLVMIAGLYLNHNARVLSLMMGLWFAATFPGDVLGGWLGGFWSTMEKAHFFLMIGSIAGLAGVAMLALNPALRSVFDEAPASKP